MAKCFSAASLAFSIVSCAGRTCSPSTIKTKSRFIVLPCASRATSLARPRSRRISHRPPSTTFAGGHAKCQLKATPKVRSTISPIAQNPSAKRRRDQPEYRPDAALAAALGVEFVQPLPIAHVRHRTDPLPPGCGAGSDQAAVKAGPEGPAGGGSSGVREGWPPWSGRGSVAELVHWSWPPAAGRCTRPLEWLGTKTRHRSSVDSHAPPKAHVLSPQFDRVCLNWPPFRPDTRHSEGGLGICPGIGLCRTTTSGSN